MSHSPFLIGGGLLPPVEFVVQLYVPGHDLHLKILRCRGRSTIFTYRAYIPSATLGKIRSLTPMKLPVRFSHSEGFEKNVGFSELIRGSALPIKRKELNPSHFSFSHHLLYLYIL